MFSTPGTRSRRTRGILATAAATAALLALSACGSSSGVETLDESADVTITMWTGQEDSAQKYLEALADEFEQEHPNVKIDLSPGASSTEDLLQKLSAGFAGNNYPDISYAFGSWAGQLEASNRTLDITDQVADPAVKWDEFSPAARDTARPSGNKTIGFPAVVDNISLLYNKKLFDAAGVAYPTDEWTWDDFRAAAKQVSDPGQNIYGYAYSVSGSEETTWQFWPKFWQNGGEILNGDQTEATFNSKAGVDALAMLQGMAIDDKSVYLDQTDTKFGQLFASDRIGMITSGPWQLYDLGVAGTEYGVTQLPGTDGDHKTVSGADIWALFDHKDANKAHWAFEFTNWLTQAEQDEQWNVAYGNLPLRASEIDSPAFQEQAAKLPGLTVMAANAVNAEIARPTLPGYVGLSEAVGQAISEVLQGKGEPDAALDAAVEKANKALAED
ncbi:extracellular solute-binding protein [Arthrobacter yangruifuii]|uniref:Extracellular solute-binding protein n=1 Tax=Arthrobacter yangruifuii TaxID=2606616 RepID=A0A5N6MSN2_9MICC|nr:ABC transporter substrate-binding protein [Arthrobacter yangruifuii]KAD4060195.1 extracellular solute-binding protein [Arthrobacter yangruifuii]